MLRARLSPRLLPPALLAAALLSGCTSGGDDDAPATFRPPPAGALQDGPCSLVAEDVVDLGRLSFDLRGSATADQESKDLLLAAQERVAAVAETAAPPAKAALDTLVLRTGLVRLQTDTGQLKDEVLEALTEAYDDAVVACSASAASATPTVTTG